MKILTSAQMQQVDRLTTERFGVLGLTLMETAGHSATIEIERHFGPLPLKHVKIFCGRGNNGGDGAVIARQLWLRGAIVELFLLGKLEETRGDARVNFEAIKKLATVETPKLSFQELDLSDELHDAFSEPCDLYVDALFGTGAARPLAGIFKELAELLNESAVPVVSVDIPSGLNADKAEIIGPTVRARVTITMTAPKIANVLPPALHYNGTLITIPIGSPNLLVDSCGSQLTMVESDQVASFLASTHRSAAAFKNDVGHVLLVAGGRGKTGAAGLAAEAVLRAGAGLVTLATPASCQQSLAAAIALEAMIESLPETNEGTIAASALQTVLNLAENKSLIAVGPGLGVSEDSRNFMRSLIEQRPGPLVIDADGLNSLSPWPDNLRGSAEKPLILTPHPGEMARLVNKKSGEVVNARIDMARKFATTNEVILILKGERTLIAAPDGEVFINPTGNAGMATAGSGDVLTGIIAGLLAQTTRLSSKALDTVIAGVYLHGLAGDIAAKKLGLRSLMASDLIKQLAAAFIAVGGEIEKRNIYNPLSR